MLVPIAFAFLVSLAAADSGEDLSYPGKCTQLDPVENFDIKKYVNGTWYTVYYHAKGNWFQQQHCPECRTTFNETDNTIFVQRYYLNDSRPVWYNKTKEHLVAHPGSFQSPQSVRDEKPDWWHHVISKVVFTDYTNYAFIYGCYDVEGEDKHYEFALISSRQRSLSPQYYDDIKAYYNKHYPSLDFHPIAWDDCRATCPQAQ